MLLCFLDFEKAFTYSKMIVLKSTNIDDKRRINSDYTEEIRIQRGVRQGKPYVSVNVR